MTNNNKALEAAYKAQEYAMCETFKDGKEIAAYTVQAFLEVQDAEELAKVLHKWNCGHLTQEQQDSYWQADKHQCESKATAIINHMKEQLK